MKIKKHSWNSKILEQTLELKTYGDSGKPLLVFPTRGGNYFDFENFGMVDACKEYIENGEITIYAIDSIDHQSWLKKELPPSQRAARHEAYDQYIIEEVIPFIKDQSKFDERIMVSGCDMGGYHASNVFFKHPEHFDALICLSGFFHLQMFIGDYVDETVYYNSPLYYLPKLNDPNYLSLYRESKIVICVGQGKWEEPMMANAHAMKQVLADKKVPAIIDFWGYDVNHDWEWWRKQLPYFLDLLGY